MTKGTEHILFLLAIILAFAILIGSVTGGIGGIVFFVLGLFGLYDYIIDYPKDPYVESAKDDKKDKIDGVESNSTERVYTIKDLTNEIFYIVDCLKDVHSIDAIERKEILLEMINHIEKLPDRSKVKQSVLRDTVDDSRKISRKLLNNSRLSNSKCDMIEIKDLENLLNKMKWL